MNEQEQIAWLARRAGWGPVPGQLDEWEQLGVDTVVDRLTDPDGAGVEAPGDPFAGVDRSNDGDRPLRTTVGAWLAHAVTGARPLETRMQFFWHDFFAVSAAVVVNPGYMHDHFALLARHGLGNFGDLLREVTVDAAMLVFLDGARSTGNEPNENYGRELLELYSVGVGNFTEADVRAAAIALTGWYVARRLGGRVGFAARRHDDTPQTLLGATGVHDVDTVIAAVLDHPATAARVVQLVATELLGPGVDPGLLERHTAAFAGDYELGPLVRGLLADGLEGAGREVIVEPVPWFVAALRATGATPDLRRVAPGLQASGQIPFVPPNVGGFPPPSSYLSTSATVGRFNMASAIAAATPADAAVRAAVDDLDALAHHFGVVGGFSATTRAALATTTNPTDRLAAALAAPELIVA